MKESETADNNKAASRNARLRLFDDDNCDCGSEVRSSGICLLAAVLSDAMQDVIARSGASCGGDVAETCLRSRRRHEFGTWWELLLYTRDITLHYITLISI